MSETAIQQLPNPVSSDIQALLIRAQSGDVSCLPELREALDDNPTLWKEVGDLGQHAELSMLRLAAASNLFVMEAMKRKLADLKAELAGPSPLPLERLLVERIAIAWLQVHYLDLEVAGGLATTNTPQAVYAQRRLDSANRRYLQGLRQLATVRRLLARDSRTKAGSKSAKIQPPSVRQHLQQT